MVTFATIVLFSQIVELPFTNESTLTKLTFNGDADFSHVTVLDSDWDDSAWAFTVGYCYLSKFENKAVPGVKYIALTPGPNYTYTYPKWLKPLSRKPRIAPELSQCGPIKPLI